MFALLTMASVSSDRSLLPFASFAYDGFKIFHIQNEKIIDHVQSVRPTSGHTSMYQYRLISTPHTPSDLNEYCECIYVAVRTSPSTHSIFQLDDDGMLSVVKRVDRPASSIDIGGEFDLILNNLFELNRFCYHYPENIGLLLSEYLLHANQPSSVLLPIQ